MSVFDDDTKIDIREALITQRQIGASRIISNDVLDGLDRATVESYLDAMLEGLVVQLRAYVNTEKLAEKRLPVTLTKVVYFDSPATWWQHFKRDVLGRVPRLGPALLRWRPVALKTNVKRARLETSVVVEQFAVFPESPLKMPEHMRGQTIVRYESAHAEGGDLA